MTLEFPAESGLAESRGRTPSDPSGTATLRRVAVLMDMAAERDGVTDAEAAPAQSTLDIMSALESLGYEPVKVALEEACPDRWLRQLAGERFRFAFNLCESVAGLSDGEHLAAATVELLRLPMTGASSATLLFCLNKDRCAAMLRAHGINVPDWKLVRQGDPLPADWDRFPVIVKPAAEDASNGVHANSVARSKEELYEAVDRLGSIWGQVVIQEFIEGREINLAIVGEHALPPSEIDFSALPESSPPIVSFAAKWHEGSPEDLGTRPVCPAPLPPETARELQRLAGRAWKLMEGRGYARVDVRLTSDGTAYVIDINPNPDLSPEAGLARQARAAGWSYEELIRRIVEAALASENGNHVRPPDPALAPCPAVERKGGRPQARVEIDWRPPGQQHRHQVADIIIATGAFRPDEVEVALEVFDDYCDAPGRDYWAVGAFTGPDELAGFAFYGPTPCTVGTWDLYWIAVRPGLQRSGIGRGLLQRVEQHMRAAGARLCLIETSSRDDYSQTRRFYLDCDYQEAARIAGFYDDDDDRVTYAKRFE